MSFDFIEMYKLFELKRQGVVSLAVIEKLQSWTLIITKHNTLKCIHGNSFKLCL